MKSITVGSYYRQTLRALYLSAMTLILFSGVTQPEIFWPTAILGLLPLFKALAKPLEFRLTKIAFYVVLPIIMVTSTIWSFVTQQDYFLLATNTVSAVMPVFLLRHNTARGYWLSILSLIVLTLGAVLYAEDVGSYVGFITILILATLNLNGAKLYFLSTNKQDLGAGLPIQYFLLLVKTAPVAGIVAVAIFAGFPRIKAFAIQLGKQTTENRVGYTDNIALSGGGQLNETSTPVLWIESTADDQQQLQRDRSWLAANAHKLYLKGKSLERFDGVNWYNGSNDPERPLISQVLTPATSVATVAIQPPLTQFKMYRERSNSKAIFLPHGTLYVTVSPQFAASTFVDTNANVFHNSPRSDRYTYEVTLGQTGGAATRQQSPLDVHLKNGSPDINTQIPKNLQDAPWFNAWVQSVNQTQDQFVFAAANEDTRAQSLAAGLQAYFAKNFGLTLDNDFQSNDALKDFITNKKRGHCEYFVSAAIMYLRAHGIPSRAVAGYRGGIYNSMTGMIEVQERFAHAWTELWLPDHGWVIFDPTPQALPPLEPAWLKSMKQIASAANFLMQKYLVNYNHDTQRQLLQEAATLDFRKLFDFKTISIDEAAKELVALAVCLIVLIWLLMRIIRRPDEFKGLPKFYIAFAMQIKKRKLTRQSSESFKEFHHRLKSLGAPEQSVDAYDQAIELHLYSAQQLKSSELRTLKRHLSAIQKWRMRA